MKSKLCDEEGCNTRAPSESAYLGQRTMGAIVEEGLATPSNGGALARWREGGRVRWVPKEAGGDPESPYCADGTISRLDGRRAMVKFDDAAQEVAIDPRTLRVLWASPGGNCSERAMAVFDRANSLTGDAAWLWTHCRSLGMQRKSDSGLLRDDVALFVMDLQQELRNIADAKRFDRERFDDDTSFADWAQSRARHVLGPGAYRDRR